MPEYNARCSSGVEWKYNNMKCVNKIPFVWKKEEVSEYGGSCEIRRRGHCGEPCALMAFFSQLYTHIPCYLDAFGGLLLTFCTSRTTSNVQEFSSKTILMGDVKWTAKWQFILDPSNALLVRIRIGRQGQKHTEDKYYDIQLWFCYEIWQILSIPAFTCLRLEALGCLLVVERKFGCIQVSRSCFFGYRRCNQCLDAIFQRRLPDLHEMGMQRGLNFDKNPSMNFEVRAVSFVVTYMVVFLRIHCRMILYLWS